MAEPTLLRCGECGGLLEVHPATAGKKTVHAGTIEIACTYCGARCVYPAGGSPVLIGSGWFEKKYNIHLNTAQKEAVDWLKRTGRADLFAGGDWLRLSDEKISDSDMSLLGRLVFLEQLDLSNNEITDRGAADLSGLKRLTDLKLGNNHLTDAVLPHIARLTGLTELNLEGADITDEGLTQLFSLKKLEKLNIRGTLITEEGVLNLTRNLPLLTCLKVETSALRMYPLLKAGVLPIIVDVENILELSGQDISDDELVYLKNMQGVIILDLGHNRIHGPGLAHLKDLPNLSHLKLKGNPIGDDGLSYIRDLTRLQSVDLWGTEVTNKGARTLKRSKLGLLVDHPFLYG